MFIRELSFLMEYGDTKGIKTRLLSTHDRFGILINLGHSFLFTSDRRTVQLNQNHFVILFPEEKAILQLPAIYIYLPLEPNFFNTHILSLQTFSYLPNSRGQIYSMNENTIFSVSELARKLACGYHSKEWVYYTFKESWISEIFMNIFCCISNQAPLCSCNVTTVQKIILYLEENYTEKISIDMLASKFYVSKYHLMRQFKKETGTTIHNFIQNRRIHYACRLIHAGYTPGEACYRSGFTDYSLFFKTFTKMIGTSPSQYREMPHTKTG